MFRNRVAWAPSCGLLVLLWGHFGPVFSQQLSGFGEREASCFGTGCLVKVAGLADPGRKSLRECRGAGCVPAVQVRLVLIGQKITHADGQARIQINVRGFDDFKLRASVSGLPDDSPPPLYQFRIQVTGSAPRDFVSDLAPSPEWTFSETSEEAGVELAQSVTFSVIVHVKTPQRTIKQQAKLGPYLTVSDQYAVDLFTTVIAPVMMHPRCLNCHVAGNSPTQGDDRHLHSPPVNRDTTVCTNCHGMSNGTTPGSPPGAPGWRLPPATFSFVNKGAHQLCRQLKDPSRTGGRSLQQLIDHVQSSKLIGWAFLPGPGRAAPPRWEDFFWKFPNWVHAGAACPEPEDRSRQHRLR